MHARWDDFWLRVEPTGFCWDWKGSLTYQGYGQFSVNRSKTVRAHRFAYELLVGEIPRGLVIDHLCRNRACVNPDHLLPVTSKHNVLVGFGPTAVNARRTHCTKGHPLVVSEKKDRNRTCVTCNLQYSREWKAKNAAKKGASNES